MEPPTRARAARRAGGSLLDPNIPMPDESPESEEQWVSVQLPSLPRSALACFWSIDRLIRLHPPCYLWTATCAEAVPDTWFGNMHRLFIRNLSNASQKGLIPKDWGGVRVFEPHPQGHGLHSHMICRGRMEWKAVQACATRAGLGHVDISCDRFGRARKVTQRDAFYLCKYLTKDADALIGCRRWACIGNYSGITKNSIEFDSDRIRKIKAWQWYFREKGMHRFLAYKAALEAVKEGDTLPGTVPF